MIKFFEGLFLLVGMIIGAGIFAIPFSFHSAGFWLGTVELGILAAVVVALHLSYAEIVMGTAESHGLPGYVKMYLGKVASFISWVSTLFGISGVLLVYVLMGSSFLRSMIQFIRGSATPILLNDLFLVFLVVFMGSLVTYFPLRKEAAVNGILTALLVAFIIFLVALLFPLIDFKNLEGVNLEQAILPYGVILFALSGAAAVPEVVAFLGKESKRVRSVVILGTTVPAIIYFFFALAIVGVSGELVSPEAIQGLVGAVDERVLFLGAGIGFLAIFTSLIVLSKYFQTTLNLDFGLSRITSWAAASLIPPFLYLVGFKNFVLLIAIVGVIATGIDSALIIGTLHRMQRLRGNGVAFLSYLWKVGVYIIIVAAVLYELFKLVGGW